MPERNLQPWLKLAFKLLVSTEWEKVSDCVEDGDETYRWIKEQIYVALKKIESDYFQKPISAAALNMHDRLKMLKGSHPNEQSFSEAVFWLKNFRGKSVLTDSSQPAEHRVIGAKLALLEIALVHFDDLNKAGSYFCQVIESMYDTPDIEAAIDEKSNPELAARVKVVYDGAKEYADSMHLVIGDWIEMEFTPDSLPKEKPPPYQPPSVWAFGDFGKEDGLVYYPYKVQIDVEGNFLVMDENVAGEGTVQRLQLFNPKGKFMKVLLMRGDGKVGGMTDFCLDNNGNIVVCDDADSARIRAFDYDGNETLSINVSADEQSSDAPHHIVCVYVDAGGLIYAADSGASCVCIYHPDGKLKARFGKHGDGEGEFKGFSSLCVDDGKIYVVDGQTSRTQIFDADGNYMSSFGSNVAPAHLMIHNGQAYAVNHDNHEVEVYSMDGEKQTKTEGGFGEGLEQFWFPSSAAAMKDGSIAISERENHRVKVFKFQ